MRVVDPGHQYALACLDEQGQELLTFVKREGPGYPGNRGHYGGTNIQEMLRALINRVQYLDNQIGDIANLRVIGHLRACIIELELRAAQRHRRAYPMFGLTPELLPTCPSCGHVECAGACAYRDRSTLL